MKRYTEDIAMDPKMCASLIFTLDNNYYYILCTKYIIAIYDFPNAIQITKFAKLKDLQ